MSRISRERLPLLEQLNRAEAAVMRASALLPSRPPARWVLMVSNAARGGGLWLVIAAGLALRPGAARRSAVRGVIALVATISVSHVLGKALVGRRRPHAETVPARLALDENPRSSAFPSAHAASAAAFTTALALEAPAIGTVVAPLAAVVLYSRVRTHVHWPTDVVGGALLGITTATLTRRLLPRSSA